MRHNRPPVSPVCLEQQGQEGKSRVGQAVESDLGTCVVEGWLPAFEQIRDLHPTTSPLY